MLVDWPCLLPWESANSHAGLGPQLAVWSRVAYTKQLSFKTVVILVITKPTRSADLSQLDAKRMRYESLGVTVYPTVLVKQSCQGKLIKGILFPSFSHNANLCPAKTLRTYLGKTESLWGNETRLFVSHMKHHKAITSSSNARQRSDGPGKLPKCYVLVLHLPLQIKEEVRLPRKELQLVAMCVSTRHEANL